MNKTLQIIQNDYRDKIITQFIKHIEYRFNKFEEAAKLANQSLNRDYEIITIINMSEYLKPNFKSQHYFLIDNLFPGSTNYYKYKNSILDNLKLTKEIIEREFYNLNKDRGKYKDFIDELKNEIKLDVSLDIKEDIKSFYLEIDKHIDSNNNINDSKIISKETVVKKYIEDIDTSIRYLVQKHKSYSKSPWGINFFKPKLSNEEKKQIQDLEATIQFHEELKTQHEEFYNKLCKCLKGICKSNNQNSTVEINFLEKNTLIDYKEKCQNFISSYFIETYSNVPKIAQQTLQVIKDIAPGLISEENFNETFLQMFQDTMFLNSLSKQNYNQCSKLFTQVYFSKYYKLIKNHYLKFLKRSNHPSIKEIYQEIATIFGWEDVFTYLNIFKKANEIENQFKHEKEIVKNTQNKTTKLLNLILINKNINVDESTREEIKTALSGQIKCDVNQLLLKTLEEMYTNTLYETKNIYLGNESNKIKQNSDVEFNVMTDDLTSLNKNDLSELKKLNINWTKLVVNVNNIWKQTNLNDYNLISNYLPFKKNKNGSISKKKLGKDTKKINLIKLNLESIQKIYLHEKDLFNKYFFFDSED